jgi:predicted alpha/beta-fold hydrolase
MTHFQPPRWLRGRHAQTVWASVFRMPIRLPLTHERWELPDGDFLDVDLLAAPAPDAPVIVVCHGLEGSSKAGYVRGVLGELRARGLGAVALNFRGCSASVATRCRPRCAPAPSCRCRSIWRCARRTSTGPT